MTETRSRPSMRAIVLADGDPPTTGGLDAAWPGWDDALDLVVAADGGAHAAAILGLGIDHWVGDADSLPEADLAELEARGVPIERSPAAKDESDAELAVLAAIRLGATDLTILGALGGRRLDHALANIGLLAHPDLAGVDARILDPSARISLVTADPADPGSGPTRRSLAGRVGDLVSLLPWGGDVMGVTTHGLRYPLRDEPLRMGPARGLSNVRIAADAAVSVRTGRLLVIESPATLDP